MHHQGVEPGTSWQRKLCSPLDYFDTLEYNLSFFFFYTNSIELRLKTLFQPPPIILSAGLAAPTSCSPPRRRAPLALPPPPTCLPSSRPRLLPPRRPSPPRRRAPSPLPVVYTPSGFASLCGPSSSRPAPASGLPPPHARMPYRPASSKQATKRVGNDTNSKLFRVCDSVCYLHFTLICVI